MKETIISGSIFFIICLLCFLSIRNTEDFTKHLNEATEKCEFQINSENWSVADSEIKKAREFFVKKTRTLENYLLHDDIERLSDILTDIEISVLTRDKTSAISAIKILKRRINELAEDDKPTFNNIF